MRSSAKRILASLMVVLIVLTSAPVGTLADVEWSSFSIKAEAYLNPLGQCGEDLYWKFDEETGALTISGTGEFYTSGLMFSGNKDIKSVHIPSSVTEIPGAMFSGCYDLAKVTGGENVKSVGGHSFLSCPKLNSVSFLSQLTYVGELAFAGCNLSELVFDNDITVYVGAFSESTVEKVEFRAGATIHNSAFSYTPIDEVIFPETEASVSLSLPAFSFCSELEELYIPATVNNITMEAGSLHGDSINNLSNLKKITVSENNSYYTIDEN